MYLQNCSIISENIVIAFWHYYRNGGILMKHIYIRFVQTNNIPTT